MRERERDLHQQGGGCLFGHLPDRPAHPFAAVTKEDGVYEIKNAPAGVDVELVYWHESMSKPEVLGTINLKDTTTKDFKIK